MACTPMVGMRVPGKVIEDDSKKLMGGHECLPLTGIPTLFVCGRVDNFCKESLSLFN